MTRTRSTSSAAARTERSGGQGREQTGETAEPQRGGGVLLALFMASLLIPIRLNLAGLTLSPARLLLLALFFPLLFRLLTGRAGPMRASDLLMMGLAAWMGIALLANHGMAKIEFIGITVVEMLGGYLVGRTLVCSGADYRAFFRYFGWGLVVLLPFVLFEQATRIMPLSRILGAAFETFPYVNYEQRIGLNRVQAVFEHPILYGLFCSVFIGNAWFLLRDRLPKAFIWTGLGIFMTFMSVSSAAVLSMMLQLGMIVWDWLTGSRWRLLTILGVIFYITIDLLSNRSPAEVLISYATFNQSTAYNRILIWEWGVHNVKNNPLFGLGLNDWERAFWMPVSIDNFWMVIAVRYGLPGIGLLLLAIAANLIPLVRRKGLAAADAQCRTGYMVAAAGLFFTLSTVHVWGATWVFFMFYLGAGVWITRAGDGTEDSSGGDEAEDDRDGQLEVGPESEPVPLPEKKPARGIPKPAPGVPGHRGPYRGPYRPPGRDNI